MVKCNKGDDLIMNNKKIYTCLILTLGISPTAYAELQYVPVQIADRVLSNLLTSGSSVSVIDEQVIEDHQYKAASDILQQNIPSAYVINNGGVGQTTTLSIRGLSQNYVKVMLDGVDISDTSSIAPFYNFAFLPSHNIQQIEVLRGSQSTLYGSDAIAAVVNIQSVDDKDKLGFSGKTNIMGGSFGTLQIGGDLSYQQEHWGMHVYGNYFRTDGISAASEDNGNMEKDAAESVQIGTKFWRQLSDNWIIESGIQYLQGKNEYDGFDYMSGLPADAENKAKTQQYLGFMRLKGEGLLDGRLNSQTQLSGHYIERLYKTEGRQDEDSYKGYNIKLDTQIDYSLLPNLTVALGGDYKQSGVTIRTSYSKQDETIDEYGIWSLLKWEPLDNLNLTLSGRYQYHELYDDHITGRMTASYKIMPLDLRVYGSISTGFRSPSLVEAFDPAYGNPKLKPEESFSYDIGLEKTLFDDRLRLNATYFYTEVDNNIIFGGTWPSNIYMNEGTLQSQGIELSAAWHITDYLSTGLQYSYVDSINKDTAKRSLRQPEHRFTGYIDWKLTNKLLAGLELQAFSDQIDYGDVSLAGYALVNARAEYQLNDMFKLKANVNNILDKDYQQINGYSTTGVAAYVGLETVF